MRFGRALALIALAGLAARLVYALAVVKSKPLLGDALEFHLQANLLADGKGYIQPFLYQGLGVARASADKPPLYPFLEAAVTVVGGRSWQAHQLVGCAAGTGTIVVTGLVGRRVAGARTGLLAAALAAAYPLLIAADGSLRSESVYALCIALVLLAALAYRDAPSGRRAALLGAAIASAALTRGEALVLVVLLALPLCGWRRGGVAVLTCVVVLAPWLVRCLVVFDRPVLISTNIGGLLAGANCATSYHGDLLGQWDFGCIPRPAYKNEALEAERLRSIGLRYARDHAERVPVVVAARLGRTFELYRPRQQAAQESFFEGRNLRVEQAGVACYYVLMALAAYGVVVLRRRDGPWLVLLAPFGLVIFVSVISYGFTRLRAGAEPALVVLAAAGIDALLARRSGSRA